MEIKAEAVETNKLRPSNVKKMMIDRLSKLRASKKPKDSEQLFNDIESLLDQTITLLNFINQRDGICRSVWNTFYTEKHKNDQEMIKLRKEADSYLTYKDAFENDMTNFVNSLYKNYVTNLGIIKNFKIVFSNYNHQGEFNFIKTFLDESEKTYNSRISDFNLLLNANNRTLDNVYQFEILKRLNLRTSLDFSPSDTIKILKNITELANKTDMEQFGEFFNYFKIFIEALNSSLISQETTVTNLQISYEKLLKESEQYEELVKDKSNLELELNEYKLSLENCHNLLKNFQSDDFLTDIKYIKDFYKNSKNILKIKSNLTFLMDSSLSQLKGNLANFLTSDEFVQFKQYYAAPPILDPLFLQRVFRNYTDSKQLEESSKNTIKEFIDKIGPTFRDISLTYKNIASNDLNIDEPLQELEKIRVLYESVSLIAENFIQISEYFGSLIHIDTDSLESPIEFYQASLEPINFTEEIYTNVAEDEPGLSNSRFQFSGVLQNNVYKNLIDSSSLDRIDEEIYSLSKDGVKRSRLSEKNYNFSKRSYKRVNAENSNTENPNTGNSNTGNSNTVNSNTFTNRKRPKNQEISSDESNSDPSENESGIPNDEDSYMETDNDDTNSRNLNPPILISDTSASDQTTNYLTSTPKKQNKLNSESNVNLPVIDESIINISDESATHNSNENGNENGNENSNGNTGNNSNCHNGHGNENDCYNYTLHDDDDNW